MGVRGRPNLLSWHLGVRYLTWLAVSASKPLGAGLKVGKSGNREDSNRISFKEKGCVGALAKSPMGSPALVHGEGTRVDGT